MMEKLPVKVKDLRGFPPFGRLRVKEYAGKTLDGKALWECLCTCGNVTVVRSAVLTRGTAKSCGCLQKELLQNRSTVHGNASHKRGLSGAYRTWSNMKRRCYNTKQDNYRPYGGRGIKICDRWLRSFEAFLEDMGPRPSDLYSIDRIDNDGNYEPGNCRWATAKEQSRNAHRNQLLTHLGETLCITAWAERLGIRADTLTRRIESGMLTRDALTIPVRKWAKKSSAPEFSSV